MSNIKLLDEQTIDSIAAGEVVERPASVLKELVENSIDSGADSITVEIRNGGKSLIRVTDNGCGIAPEEVGLAFMRHATSKLRSISDLTRIASLGFRGEALSSIAAVSKTELITRTKENITGIRYRIEGGTEIDKTEIGAPYGTTVIVRDLFFNTPVRAGFMKSSLTEKNAVTAFMEQLSLSHPEISFNYTADGKQVLFTSGSGDLLECAYHIFGREVTKHLIPIDTETELLKIRGYLGLPEISRGNRNFENYYINGRYIKDKTVSAALEEAYKGHLMQQRFPFVLLDITVDRDKVDVNVHPSKMEVRFSDPGSVFEGLRDTIANVLLKNEEIPHFDIKTPKKAFSIKPSAYKKEEEHSVRTPAHNNETAPWNPLNEEALFEKMPEPERSSSEAGRTVSNPAGGHTGHAPEAFETRRIQAEKNQYIPGTMPELVREKQISIFDEAKDKPDPVFNIVGQVFETYVIVEYKTTMYIIDQHAAHEKVMFEKYMREIREKKVNTQYLMPAKLITLTAAENDLFAESLFVFEEMGFCIEHFEGLEWKITGVPSNLYITDTDSFFKELLDGLFENGSAGMLPDRIATKACKAAVKGNMKLSYAEINALIRDLLKLEDPYHCPHGRPTMISMTHYELDKKFKRIV